MAGPLIADPARSPPLPDPALTPGDALTADAAVVCVPGYTKTVRDVPQSVKNRVYRQHGVMSREPREYEVNHLISLELGDSHSIRNLWPESYVTQPLNAHVKDRLENKLHRLVCAGALPLEQAQREIAADWTKAYEKYVEICRPPADRPIHGSRDRLGPGHRDARTGDGWRSGQPGWLLPRTRAGQGFAVGHLSSARRGFQLRPNQSPMVLRDPASRRTGRLSRPQALGVPT